MSDQELQQRIKYLVEHGGLWEDPNESLRRLTLIGVWVGAISAGVHLILHVVALGA